MYRDQFENIIIKIIKTTLIYIVIILQNIIKHDLENLVYFNICILLTVHLVFVFILQ